MTPPGINFENLSLEMQIARRFELKEEALLSRFAFHHLPESGELRIQMIEKDIQRQIDEVSEFGIPSQSRPEDQWVTVAYRSGNGQPTSVLLTEPQAQARHYIKEWNHQVTAIGSDEYPLIRDRYLARFSVCQVGSCEITEGEVRVTLTQNRLASLSENEIALGHTIFSEGSHEWRGANIPVEFYSLFVSPHLPKHGADTTPLQWAVDRIKLIAGSVLPFTGHDHSLCALEEPFIALAPYAANLASQEHGTTKIFERSAGAQRILDLVPTASPEMLYLLLSLPEKTAEEMLQRPAVNAFFAALPEYLSRGLQIEKVVELAHAVSAGTPECSAAEHAISIATSVFSQPVSERPWWFHENSTLIPSFRSESWGQAQNLQQHRELAANSGAAYQYAAEVWEHRGSLFDRMEGVSQHQAIELTTQITNDYGIGNVSRACNVLDFAIAALQELAPGERAGCLKDIFGVLHEKRPESEVVGVLEGDDAHFYKPGVFHLLLNLSKGAQRSNLYNITMTPEELAEAVRSSSRPLEERALIDSHMNLRSANPRLITDLRQSGALRLPVPEEYRLSGPTSTPINRWIQFDRLVAREIVHQSKRAEVADMYLGLYAHKFPEPLNPPEGFLRSLARFKSLPDPNYRFTGLEHPDDRNARSALNERSEMNRNMIIAGLIDTAVVGLISWQEMTDLVAWMVVETGDAGESAGPERIEAEIDLSWEKYWHLNECRYSHQTGLAWHDQELLEELRRLEDNLSRWERIADRPDAGSRIEYLKEEIKVLNGRRENLAADYEIYMTGGYRDLVEESKTQQQREEEMASRVFEFIDSEVSSQIDQIGSERVTRMGGALRVLRLAHSIVAAGVIPNEQFSPLIKTLLAGVRSGEFDFSSHAPEAAIDSKRFAELLGSMKELGVVDVEKLLSFGGRQLSDAEVAHAITTIWHIAGAFDRAVSLVGEAAENQSRFGRYRNRDLEHQVQQTLQGVTPFLENNKVEQAIINAYDWMARYQVIGPSVRALSDRLLPSASESEIREGGLVAQPGGALVSSNRTIVNTWLFVEASVRFRSEGVTPFLEQSLGSETGELPDIAHTSKVIEGPSGRSLTRTDRNLVRTCAPDDIAAKFEDFRDWLIEQRERDFGKLPIGGKIHVLHWIDENRLDVLKRAFGLGATSFQVENASQSLILPPMASALEIDRIAQFLSFEKIIDHDFPEIQMCIAGRLDPSDCAILGASVILASDRLVLYNPDSFTVSSGHNHLIGYRIMMYDDNGARGSFPFDVRRGGRTDMQGRKIVSDFVIYQTLGTVLSYASESPEQSTLLHPQDLAEFREIADWYRAEFRGVLSRYRGLERVLDELWVHPRVAGKGVAEQLAAGEGFFANAIQPLTQAYQRSLEITDSNGNIGGVLGDVERLTAELSNRVSFVQRRMLEHPHYAHQRQQLFSL